MTRSDRWGPEPAPTRAFWVATTGIVLLATAGLFVVVSQGAIMNDDIEHLRFAQESGLTLDYLFTPVFDHFAPGHRLLVQLHLLVGPLRFGVMYALLALLVGASGLVATHLLASLYGARWWVPVFGALVVINPFTVDVTGWFASAYHQVPALLLGLLAVDTFVTHRRTGRRRWLVASVAAVVLGMLFVSKILLFVGLVVLLDHLLLHDEPLGRVPRSIAEQWPMWMAYAVPVLIYLALAAQTIEERPVGSAADVVSGTRVIWLARFVPSLFGLDVSADPDGTMSGEALALAILAQVLLAVLAAVLVYRRRSSARALVILLLVFVVNAVMTLTTRVSLFGPGVGLELYRYWLEPFVIACLLLPWGFARTDRELPSEARRVSATLAIGLLALTLGGSAYASWSRHEASQNVAAGQWFAHAKRSLADLDAPEVPVVDDRMPEALVPYWIAEGSTVSRLEPLVDGLVFSGDPDGYVFTGTGRLVPVRFDPWFEASGQDITANGLISITGDSETRGSDLCFDEAIRIEVILAPPEESQFLQVSADAEMQVQHRALRAGRVADPEPNAEASVPAGGGSVILPLTVSPADAHGLTLTPHSGEGCLERMDIGPIAQTPPMGWGPGVGPDSPAPREQPPG